jgi:hypothetical protein
MLKKLSHFKIIKTNDVNNNNNEIWKNLNKHRNEPTIDRSLMFDDDFEIVFDIYTPRPHFIIKFKDEKHHFQMNGLSDDQIVKILNLVLEFRRRFSLLNSRITLSFHTGTWVIKT